MNTIAYKIVMQTIQIKFLECGRAFNFLEISPEFTLVCHLYSVYFLTLLLCIISPYVGIWDLHFTALHLPLRSPSCCIYLVLWTACAGTSESKHLVFSRCILKQKRMVNKSSMDIQRTFHKERSKSMPPSTARRSWTWFATEIIRTWLRHAF